MEPGLFDPEGVYGYNPSDLVVVGSETGLGCGKRAEPDKGVGPPGNLKACVRKAAVTYLELF